jgi:hypothetical protein
MMKSRLIAGTFFLMIFSLGDLSRAFAQTSKLKGRYCELALLKREGTKENRVIDDIAEVLQKEHYPVSKYEKMHEETGLVRTVVIAHIPSSRAVTVSQSHANKSGLVQIIIEDSEFSPEGIALRDISETYRRALARFENKTERVEFATLATVAVFGVGAGVGATGLLAAQYLHYIDNISPLFMTGFAGTIISFVAVGIKRYFRLIELEDDFSREKFVLEGPNRRARDAIEESKVVLNIEGMTHKDPSLVIYLSTKNSQTEGMVGYHKVVEELLVSLGYELVSF